MQDRHNLSSKPLLQYHFLKFQVNLIKNSWIKNTSCCLFVLIMIWLQVCACNSHTINLFTFLIVLWSCWGWYSPDYSCEKLIVCFCECPRPWKNWYQRFASKNKSALFSHIYKHSCCQRNVTKKLLFIMMIQVSCSQVPNDIANMAITILLMNLVFLIFTKIFRWYDKKNNTNI